MSLPYLTRDFPGIGGTLKNRAEDFFVQEIPLYEPSGEGEHVYAEVQKVGLTTFDAINRIADALRIFSREIGYAGLKDAKAITRQVFSIPGVSESAVMHLKLPGMSVLWAARHGNKIRLGHLKANRFAIKIREVAPTDVVKLRPVLAEIERRGMPNYFGEQRFGRRGDNDVLGAAYVRGDHKAVLSRLLGTPDPKVDDPETARARAAFDQHDLEKAMQLYPRRHGMERRVLHRLMKTHRPSSAVWTIDEKIRRLWVSALQSRVFNQIVARRIDTIDRLMDGDFAYKHENGACFLVENAAAEQPRAEAFEISPTGPLIGYRVSLPTGEPLGIEQEAFSEHGLTPADFKQSGSLRVKGDRRPLRVRPTDVELAAGVDEHGSHITVAFTLPAGSFATVLLRELMKSKEPEDAQTKSEAPDDTQTPPDNAGESTPE
ncbi:MAG TPA: tRNA pseudouridine(13) synthase TruD [Tepidisphaeraceae bacterium]|nr:tRNA pseudouridine(13) synthase TruD [Tepidisphaeraceae bacterium]